jgi:hypothetical protein
MTYIHQIYTNLKKLIEKYGLQIVFYLYLFIHAFLYIIFI